MQVREVVASVEDQQRASTAEPLQEAKVTAVQQMPMGERVCVDLCSRLSPGEGLLVGNFCRTLFLVHSEVRARALTLRCACAAIPTEGVLSGAAWRDFSTRRRRRPGAEPLIHIGVFINA